MIKEVQIFKAFIASPSDTEKERLLCDLVFERVNKNLGEYLGFRIESKKWEKDTYPSFGNDGQDVINSQLLDDFQIFIGIMWHKFGTPTPRAGSGTEEEFDLAYKKYTNGEALNLFVYFNTASANPFELDLEQLSKVKSFKNKIAECGGLYKEYSGTDEFEDLLYNHLTSFFTKKFNIHMDKSESNLGELSIAINAKLIDRLESALCLYSNIPTKWIEPTILPSNAISESYEDNYNRRIEIEKIILKPKSAFIQSPPQFGLTCLAHYMIHQAWQTQKQWCYIDANIITRFDTAEKRVNRSMVDIGFDSDKPDCIVIDSWDSRKPFAKKFLNDACKVYHDVPIIVLNTISERVFREGSENIKLTREFDKWNLIALRRSEIREVVNEYNDINNIGNENKLLDRIISDFEALNLHRTVHNTLTLLKVTENQFEDSPANRTQMIERVLFILFNLNDKYVHKSIPDVKDCEYVLGRFCEHLLKEEKHTFKRELFIQMLNQYCEEKLLSLDVGFVFDIMYENNILVLHDDYFMFRGTYWIYYFAAKRMYANNEFKDYILNQEEFVTSPEIIEFYTGIDRNRAEVLIKLNQDLLTTYNSIEVKAGLSDEVIPLGFMEWSMSENSIDKMKQMISESVQESKLPTTLKDKYADNKYNQLKPYDQSVQTIMKEYEFSFLIQQVKAISRALRNSDYIESDLKREILSTVKNSWKQVSKILFALGPMLAQRGEASFEGQDFKLDGNFSEDQDRRINEIWFANPANVVEIFKDDLYSKKIGPLLFDGFVNEQDPIVRHILVLIFIKERPEKWVEAVSNYIEQLPYNSFYLCNVLTNLTNTYKYNFMEEEDLKKMRVLIKKVCSIHEFKGKYDSVSMNRIRASVIPKRELESIGENE